MEEDLNQDVVVRVSNPGAADFQTELAYDHATSQVVEQTSTLVIEKGTEKLNQ